MPMPLATTFGECLRLAWAQLEQARPAHDADAQPVLHLASWMNWAMTIDESLRVAPAYVQARRHAAGGQALVGLRHPWNLLKHEGQRLQDLLLVNIQPDRPIVTRGDHPPRSRPVVAAAWEARWKPIRALPRTTPGTTTTHYRANQEQAYVTHLAERSVK